MTEILAKTWLELGTPTLSDALDRLGVASQCQGIRMQGGSGCAGPAFTVRYLPVGVSGGTVGDYVDDVPPNAVIVLDNNGRTDVSVWGGLLSLAAIQKQLAGTIIDGVHRDTQEMKALGYSLFSRGAFMRTGKDRVAVVAINEDVQLSGIRVANNDLVIADDDGVVVIPQHSIEKVLEVAQTIQVAETKISEALRNGQRLDEARNQVGYFNLQRHEK